MTPPSLLRLEPLDDRCVPSAAGRYAVGAGPGGPPRVQLYESAGGKVIADFLAFENTFTGGVTVAIGDVNNDGFPDLVVGASVGGGPRVRVFNGTALGTTFNPGNKGAVLADFFAFESSQRGGVNVAVGNFIGTLNDDLVVGAGPGGGPRVRVINGQSIATQGGVFNSNRPGDTVADFFAFESSFRNGVTVAATPVTAGSFSDLVVAPGGGGAPRVRVLSGAAINTRKLEFDGTGPSDAVADFFSGDTNSRAGLSVGFADVSGDGIADVITGTGPGVPAVVTVYDGAAIKAQKAAFTGTGSGDRIDQFTPLANYHNGVTVGTTINTGGAAAALLAGLGGAGSGSEAVFLRYAGAAGTLAHLVVFDSAYDPTLVIGVNVSN